jgi:hypothetical protein
MQQYKQLMTKFALLKEKECAITGQSAGKRERKDMLLSMKADNTITKEGNEELKFIEREHDIEDRYASNIRVIEESKERAIRAAEDAYEKALRYYNSEKERSLNTLRRTHDEAMRKIEEQKKKIEGERALASKTAAEIALEQDKRKILQEMQSLIRLMEMSKSQVSAEYRDRLPPVPALPEAIETHYVAPAAVAVTTPVAIAYDPNTPLPLNITSSSDLAAWEAKAASGREEIRERRAEQKRKEREREIAESNRKPTVYGFVHELEKRAAVKATYVATPVRDEEETCTFFTEGE